MDQKIQSGRQFFHVTLLQDYRDIQGIDMDAHTLQQACVRIGLNGIADLEALGEDLA
jgi:hypothetical protein